MAEDEAYGVDGIMLDGKTLDFCVAESEALSGLKAPPVAVGDAAFSDHQGCFRGSKNRHGKLPQEDPEAPHVVAVFVCQQDAREAGRIHTQRDQS